MRSSFKAVMATAFVALVAASPALAGYADVNVQPPRELDACFVRPLDLEALARFLGPRFGRRRSGAHGRLDRLRSVPPAPALAARRRR